jgi:hypothetical protein
MTRLSAKTPGGPPEISGGLLWHRVALNNEYAEAIGKIRMIADKLAQQIQWSLPIGEIKKKTWHLEWDADILWSVLRRTNAPM